MCLGRCRHGSHRRDGSHGLFGRREDHAGELRPERRPRVQGRRHSERLRRPARRGEDAGAGRTVAQTDNPFDFTKVCVNIRNGLEEHGYTMNKEYVVMKVPNIVDISYGRGVGYTFTEHDLGEEVHKISATKIRAHLREKGEL